MFSVSLALLTNVRSLEKTLATIVFMLHAGDGLDPDALKQKSHAVTCDLATMLVATSLIVGPLWQHR